jgi:hypothetical protein
MSADKTDTGTLFNPWNQFIGSLIPNWLLCRDEVSPGAKLCYGRLMQYAGKNGRCFPSHATLGRELGVKPRQVANYVAELRVAGLIVPRVSPGKSTEYGFARHPWMDTPKQDIAVLPMQHVASNPCDKMHDTHVTSCILPMQDVADIRESLSESISESASETPKNGARRRQTSTPAPPGVEVFRQVTGRYPPKNNYEQVSAAIGERTADELQPYYDAWTARSNNHARFDVWLFEWVAGGRIPQTVGHNGIPAAVPSEVTPKATRGF